MSKIPVSCCMIVQNEEKYIEKAILNVREHVGEIVVVDGGSTDNTIKIAKELGCNVVENKFDFDFSKQRNFGAEQCINDWVLWIDADEYFSEEFFGLLPTLITSPPENCAAYHVFRKSIFDNEERGTDFQWRLTNKVFAKWVNKIHENIEFNSGYTGFKVPEEFYMTHDHSMKRQRYNNALYYNVNQNINKRPDNNKGMEYHDESEKWIIVENNRDE